MTRHCHTVLRLLCALALSALAVSGPVRAATVFAFSAPGGTRPQSRLTLGPDGNFYGTTSSGGANGQGTVFRVSPAGELTTLYTFSAYQPGTQGDPINADGTSPYATMTLGPDGNFYGTTPLGGVNGAGTVFRITPGGEFTVLHAFRYSEGTDTYDALTLGPDGNFYGIATGGGPHGTGSAFRLTPDGHFAVLHVFGATSINGDNAHGANPFGSLTLGTDGNLYGTTEYGGVNGAGTVFKMTPAGELTTLHTFAAPTHYYPTTNADGAYPLSALVRGSDGSFFGTTDAGSPNGSGTVFHFTPNGAFKTLYRFSPTDSNYQNADGAFPLSLVRGPAGCLYGTTNSGGRYDAGTAFEITPQGQFTLLHAFQLADGASANGLTAGLDGALYGTANYYGPGGLGTIFKLTLAGTKAGNAPALARFTLLYAFAAPDGSTPDGSVVQATDGNFYGTTSAGGPLGSGTVYKLTPGGTLTTLHAFSATDSHFRNADGAFPHDTLIQGTDGALYGTALYGGTNGNGTVFRLALDGTFTVLYTFSNTRLVNNYFSENHDGANPIAGLTQGPDGAFYGAAEGGGPNADGTLFKVDAQGTFTVLHQFGPYYTRNAHNTDGALPVGGLTLRADGNFYGTTIGGGIYDGGTLLRITPDGVFSVRHSFNDPYLYDGENPNAGVTVAPDGNLFGTTSRGGKFGYGTTYQLAPGGKYTVLHSFTSNADGSAPYAPLTLVPTGPPGGTTGGDGIAPPGFTGGGYRLIGTCFTGGGYKRQTATPPASGTPAPSGPPPAGTVFSQNGDGSVTPLHTFYGANGANPTAPVVEGTDGYFYGTAAYGGPGLDGVIYRFAQPNLSALSPPRHGCGSAFPLTLTGSGFVVGSVVLLTGPEGSANSVTRTLRPTSATNSVLTVTVPPIERTGAYSVTVQAPVPSLAQSNALPFTLVASH